MSELDVLLFLYGRDAAATAVEISGQLRIGEYFVGLLLDRLVRSGLVRRGPAGFATTDDPGNRATIGRIAQLHDTYRLRMMRFVLTDAPNSGE